MKLLLTGFNLIAAIVSAATLNLSPTMSTSQRFFAHALAFTVTFAAVQVVIGWFRR